MKKTRGRYLSVVLLLMGGLQLGAQNQTQVEVTTSFQEFRTMSSRDNLKMVAAKEGNYFYPEDSKNPMLPLRTVSVLVPNGAVLTDFSFSSEKELVERDLELRCATSPIPTTGEEVARRPITSFQGVFPEYTIVYNSTLVQRGYTWFSFTFSPFTYESDSKELFLVTKLNLDVEYRIDESETSVIRPESAVRQRMKKISVNAEDLDRYYPSEKMATQKSAGERVDYLLLTTEALKPGFLPLVEWKNRKGLNAEIITMEEISGLYDDPTIQLKIKHCFLDYYENHNLTWVLLGGDHDVVPVQGCYGLVRNESTEIIDPSVPTDLFYACFDRKFDWNSIDDDLIGQVHRDDVDLVPEVYISRAPVKTREHVDAFVNKTLAYEKKPPRSGFTEKMLLSGIEAWSAWNGKSDSHHRSELLFANQISDHWAGEKLRFYDTGTDFPGGSEYHVTVENLTEQLNTGYGIFHFTGHGNNKYLVMEHGNRFTATNAMELTNPVSGIIFSNACDVNAFDSIDPCLSEGFLRNPDGGGIAFFGSSRFGFGNPEPELSLGPSLQYSARFARHLFSEQTGIQWNSLATVASMAKEDFIYTGAMGGTFLYLQYAINTMGDPELPIFTRKPLEFNQIRMYRMGKDLTVNTRGEESCRICLTSLELGDGYKQVVEGSSVYTFEDIPEYFQITITAPNYRPYIYIASPATGILDYRSNIRIYPNPVRDLLQIDLDRLGRLQLFDLQGRLLIEQEVFPGSNSINLSEYPAGAYMLNFIIEDGNTWYKVLKQ